VKTSKEQVHLIEQMILQGVEGLGVAGANLFEEIQRATTHLRRSEDLRGLLHSIKDQICDLGRNVAGHKAVILEQENLVSWDEIGKDLNAVLESLTTRVERISANEILALEEDVGNEEALWLRFYK